MFQIHHDHLHYNMPCYNMAFNIVLYSIPSVILETETEIWKMDYQLQNIFSLKLWGGGEWEAHEEKPCCKSAHEEKPWTKLAHEEKPCTKSVHEEKLCTKSVHEEKPCTKSVHEENPCTKSAHEEKPCIKSAHEEKPCTKSPERA